MGDGSSLDSCNAGGNQGHRSAIVGVQDQLGKYPDGSSSHFAAACVWAVVSPCTTKAPGKCMRYYFYCQPANKRELKKQGVFAYKKS
jgi:hypothetical protein